MSVSVYLYVRLCVPKIVSDFVCVFLRVSLWVYFCVSLYVYVCCVFVGICAWVFSLWAAVREWVRLSFVYIRVNVCFRVSFCVQSLFVNVCHSPFGVWHCLRVCMFPCAPILHECVFACLSRWIGYVCVCVRLCVFRCSVYESAWQCVSLRVRNRVSFCVFLDASECVFTHVYACESMSTRACVCVCFYVSVNACASV